MSYLDITEECVRIAGWGHCAFYDCVERRFPCGEDGYTKRISKHFCSKIDTAYNNFDAFVSLSLKYFVCVFVLNFTFTELN